MIDSNSVDNNGSESVSLVSEVNKSTEQALGAASLSFDENSSKKLFTLPPNNSKKLFTLPPNNSKKLFTLPPNNKARADDHPFLGTKNDRKPEYIRCDNEEEKKLLFSDSPADSSENKNHGKYVLGNIVKEAEQEASKHVKNSTLKSLQLRVRSPLKTMLTSRVILDSDKAEIKISDFLNSDFCKKSNITALTIMLPNDEKRGMRGRIDENGTRIYEVANGSYQMILKWNAQGKECIIKINIHDDGRVECISHNGIDMEHLKANNARVGRQYEAKSLYEIFAPQLEQKSSEIVRVLEQPLTNVTDTATQEHKVRAACRE